MSELSEEDKKILENLDEIHDEYQREVVLGKLFLKTQGRKPHTPNEVYDWWNQVVVGTDAEYAKIELIHLEHGCFCSLGDCKEGEFYMDQIVVCTGSNLFHPKCYGTEYKIKKPDYEDTPLNCSICNKVYTRISYETYMKVWKKAKCPGCLQNSLVEYKKQYERSK